MRKHQFVKTDCKCFKKATRFLCKHCGTMEYLEHKEIRAMTLAQAECTHADAPQVPAKEVFRGKMGGTIDCLAPDWETYMEGKESGSCETC